jgi:hypothetical protein
MFLWSPFFITALIIGSIGSLFNRIHKIFSPLAYVLLTLSNFILKLIINDVIHSSKGTPIEKYISFINQYIKKEEQ